MTEADRIARAGHYVSGLMSDAERESAERDLERDALFRDAVIAVSQRMRAIDGPPKVVSNSSELWMDVSERLAEMPQLRSVFPLHKAPVNESTNATPPRAPTIMPGKTSDTARIAIAVALLLAVFGFGYFAGVHTGMPFAPSLAQVDTSAAE